MWMTIIKWMVPASERISAWIASAIRKRINAQPEKRRAIIQKIAMIGRNVSARCDALCVMLDDGVIDNAEEKRITDNLTPAVESCKELIFKEMTK